MLQVFKYPGYTEEWAFDVGDILWLRWHPVANVLFCGTTDSEMWMWKIPSGDKLDLCYVSPKCGKYLTLDEDQDPDSH